MRQKLLIFAAAFLALLVPSPATEAQMPPRTPPLDKRIDAVFSAVTSPGAPGLAVLVRKNSRSIFQRAYGLRDLRTKSSIDPRTNFRLASFTKQFTALAIMLLVHDGKLHYDESLTEIFPDFPSYGRSITVRNLLNHTSGLRDYEDLMETAEKQKGPVWTPERQIQDDEVLSLLMRQTSGKFLPGTSWSYSNSGYVVLGLIVAKLSGRPFREFLRRRIFAPLYMDHTIAFEKGKNSVSNRAFGHTLENGTWLETDQSPTSATLGDGGIYSNLEDLAKWDEALASHTLLTEEEMQPALIPVKLADGSQPKWPADSDRPAGTPVSYGFGWFLDPYRAHTRMWHYGETRGFHTYIVRFPADQLTIFVLCNRTDLDPEKLALQTANLFLDAP